MRLDGLVKGKFEEVDAAAHQETDGDCGNHTEEKERCTRRRFSILGHKNAFWNLGHKPCSLFAPDVPDVEHGNGYWK